MCNKPHLSKDNAVSGTLQQNFSSTKLTAYKSYLLLLILVRMQMRKSHRY